MRDRPPLLLALTVACVAEIACSSAPPTDAPPTFGRCAIFEIPPSRSLPRYGRLSVSDSESNSVSVSDSDSVSD